MLELLRWTSKHPQRLSYPRVTVRPCSPGLLAGANSWATAEWTAGAEICTSACLLNNAGVGNTPSGSPGICMVLDPAAPTKALLSVDSCQIVVAKGGYKWRASYPAILLMSRTFTVDTSGQSLPDITALHFLLLIQLPQRRLPTKTWHTHCTRLSLSGAIILFLV